jgi:aspartyl-tRNA synthetase
MVNTPHFLLASSDPPAVYYGAMLRTHTCGELRPSHADHPVTLCGWVHRRRDHGGLIFIDLRDRYGITQVVFQPEDKDVFGPAEQLRGEWVLQIEGSVRKRIAGAERDDNPTGHIEVVAKKVIVLNEAKTPPFEIDIEKDPNEELRLTYRYLDLRRERMRGNIMLRHKMLQAIRHHFYSRDFVEIETPILIKGTPEGSREYLVPSRVHPGNFYVLPQSPQQLKQLSMVAGMDRYMQIARCFRDEDQRGDRQPEFTQVDVEMSFVEASDIMDLTEEGLITLTKDMRPDITIQSTPFPRLTFEEAMNRYGSDKPDIRYGLEFADVTELSKDCGFGVFANTVKAGGVVKVLRVPEGAAFSRKEIDDLTEVAKIYEAKGLAWIKKVNGAFEGVPVEKLGQEVTAKMAAAAGMQDGDILLFTADTWETACTSLGAVRKEIATRRNLADPKVFAYVWITAFPMFEKDKETGGVAAVHHPFTRPTKESEPLITTDPLKAKAQAYDIVLNGYEVGGGSVRIHEPALQKRIFDILQISDDDAEKRFGHLLKAFQFGAPPHAGIAWGFDRLVMIFAGEPNIREVIAYPKDQRAKDLMLGAPSQMPQKQIEELGIKVVAE